MTAQEIERIDAEAEAKRDAGMVYMAAYLGANGKHASCGHQHKTIQAAIKCATKNNITAAFLGWLYKGIFGKRKDGSYKKVQK